MAKRSSTSARGGRGLLLVATSLAPALACVAPTPEPEPVPLPALPGTPAAPGSLVAPAEVAAEDGVTRLSFEDVNPGALPQGWTPAETNGAGTPGRWSVTDPGDPAHGQVLSLERVANRGDTFNLLLSDEEHPADLDLRVLLHADGGREDRGGGLVWRAAGKDDYYVARWNPLEADLRLFLVHGGERQRLQAASVHADPSAWHTLEVLARGDRITVAFDRRVLLDVRDGTLSAPGAIGLWTKADAATSFDELLIAP